MPRDLPEQVTLPSGRVLKLRALRDRFVAPSGDHPFAPATYHLESSIQLSDVREGAVPWKHLDLIDFHTIRAVLTWASWVQEPPSSVRCSNCGHAWSAAACEALELGPFIHGELHDPELDSPFDFDKRYDIHPIAFAGSEATTIELRPVKAGDAQPLWCAIARPVLRITGAMVRAMGIARLGEETHPGRIARALQRASEEAFCDVVCLFDEAHYARRLFAFVHCPACGAREVIDAPSEREFPADHSLPRPQAAHDPFLDPDAFEARVRALGSDVYRERGIASVDLVVDDGVADVDDAGEPLLGSYVPVGGEDLVVTDHPEIRLYYRTFKAMWEEDGAYDLDEEIAETIHHEIDHHFGFLAGDDPIDDDEQDEIALEAERVVGRTEMAERAQAHFAGEIAAFLRRTWPIWLIVAAATTLAILADR